jgi:DNA replication initiation complex subunit (GINS family)
MYEELFDTWKLELEKDELERLPSDFFSRIAEFVRRQREESRMLEKRATKSNLLSKELRNTKRMVHQLIRTRYRKIIKELAIGDSLPLELLTSEERTIYSTVSPFAEAVRSLAKDVLRGQLPAMRIEVTHARAALRFLKEVPAIMGVDMKSYGPFKIEDISTLPVENVKILIKQGLAEKVEVV